MLTAIQVLCWGFRNEKDFSVSSRSPQHGLSDHLDQGTSAELLQPLLLVPLTRCEGFWVLSWCMSLQASWVQVSVLGPLSLGILVLSCISPGLSKCLLWNGRLSLQPLKVVHSFIQPLFIEGLLWTRCWPGPWGFSDWQDRVAAYVVPCTVRWHHTAGWLPPPSLGTVTPTAGLLLPFDFSWTHLGFAGGRRSRIIFTVCLFKVRKEEPGEFQEAASVPITFLYTNNRNMSFSLFLIVRAIGLLHVKTTVTNTGPFEGHLFFSDHRSPVKFLAFAHLAEPLRVHQHMTHYWSLLKPMNPPFPTAFICKTAGECFLL